MALLPVQREIYSQNNMYHSLILMGHDTIF
jgi:hypothetical protein